MKKLAIVILNYNGEEMLKRFIPTLLNCSEDAEIVVADNASDDNSVVTMQRCHPEVRIITLQKNWGFAEGYNRALKHVDAKYYLLLNSDVEVTEGWLDPLLSIMEADPSIAACQPKLLDYKRKTHFEYAGASGGFMDCYGYPYCRGRIFDTVEEDKGQYDTPCEIFWATGAALLVRSNCYWEVGGLDGRFFAHMEEIDFCWRLRARGHRIVCIPQSAVFHVGGATLSRSNPRKTFLNFRNNLLMLYKNLPAQRLRRVMMMRAFLDYVAAVKFLLSGDIKDFKAVVKARREYRKMRHDFLPDRIENIRCAVCENIPQMSNRSILWEYYVKGNRLFSCF
ncbi:MAG: glycosyltransferase family 2 protein [Bacteroidaceae bacterium]|nr:glycosyltransferase family 2 protein [Bacteroidaceae bacterium]